MKSAMGHWLERRMDRRSTWHDGLKSLVGAGFCVTCKSKVICDAMLTCVAARYRSGIFGISSSAKLWP